MPREWSIRAKANLAIGIVATIGLLAVGLPLWTMSTEPVTIHALHRPEAWTGRVLWVSAGLLAVQWLVLGLMFVGANRVIRRLRRLRVKAGPDQGSEGTRTDELGQLAASINDLRRELQRRTRELERARNHYKTVFEEVPVAITITRPDGTIVEANQAAWDLAGDEVEEWSELTAWDFYEDGARREAFMERLAAEGWVEGFEAWLKRPGGSRFLARISSTTRPGVEGLLYQTIIQDITDQTRRTEQLVVLNRVLRHDIGNAAGSVLGYVELLEGGADAEDRQRYRAAIRRAGYRITRLTASVRALMETVVDGTIETTPVDIAAIVGDEVAAARDIHERLEITAWSGPEEPLYVQGTEILSTVVGNLLHNTVVHSPKDRVNVSVTLERTSPETVTVRVADHGPGVPDARKETIFGKGEKGLESSGTGMGLYLASQVVQQCGGNIRVEDNEPTGAVFIIELPVVTPEELPNGPQAPETVSVTP